MAKFFDKIGELAKTASDKTNELLEQNKLNSKISAEETRISNYMEMIGEFHFQEYESGKTPESAVAQWYTAIKASQEKIKEAELELAAMKSKEESLQPEEGANTPALFCSKCGTKNKPDAKFCVSCGGQL